MLHAQMPEPVPDFEHQPVEEPPSSTPPVGELPPGAPVPTSSISDGLSATGPEPRSNGLERLVRWSGDYSGQDDERIIAGGRYGSRLVQHRKLL